MKKETTQALEIRRAQNGFTVCRARDIRHDYPLGDPYVFESFDNLVAWMRENLEGAE